MKELGVHTIPDTQPAPNAFNEYVIHVHDVVSKVLYLLQRMLYETNLSLIVHPLKTEVAHTADGTVFPFSKHCLESIDFGPFWPEGWKCPKVTGGFSGIFFQPKSIVLSHFVR